MKDAFAYLIVGVSLALCGAVLMWVAIIRILIRGWGR